MHRDNFSFLTSLFLCMPEKLRYLTSGESHGKALSCIVDGVPAGLLILEKHINSDLSRRQKGYGRGGRMKIESDTVQILSGVRRGKTLGSPINLLIENKDWPNWREIMSVDNPSSPPFSKKGGGFVTLPRPGHADLAGAIKYNTHDIRNVIERSSARETAARVAIGAIAKKFLSEFNIKVMSYVVEVGGISIQNAEHRVKNTDKEISLLFKRAEASSVRCPDKNVEKKMINKIDKAMKRGDSVGGVFEVVATGVPVGLGSYCQWDRRLNAKLAQALMSIQAIKGVEIGLGFEVSGKSGSEVMDEIFYSRSRFYRKTNNAGGIEGGISTGMPIVLRAAMKPIPTLRKPLASVDVISKKTSKAAYERSDVCAVPAAAVIAESVVAFEIARVFLQKFGGDSMEEIRRNYDAYISYADQF